jgi:hypothetical protein
MRGRGGRRREREGKEREEGRERKGEGGRGRRGRRRNVEGWAGRREGGEEGKVGVEGGCFRRGEGGTHLLKNRN